jgi:hypothetical protein
LRKDCKEGGSKEKREQERKKGTVEESFMEIANKKNERKGSQCKQREKERTKPEEKACRGK